MLPRALSSLLEGRSINRTREVLSIGKLLLNYFVLLADKNRLSWVFGQVKKSKFFGSTIKSEPYNILKFHVVSLKGWGGIWVQCNVGASLLGVVLLGFRDVVYFV